MLAAGAGSRFEGPTHKLLAPLGDATVFERSLAAVLDADLATMIVVTRDDTLDGLIPPEMVVLRNHRWAEGMATSLQVAVTWAKDHGIDALVVGLGDQPFVGSDAWRAVASAPDSIAVASYDGRRRNPVRLHRSVWPLLPSSGDEGARIVMRLHPELVGEIPCPGDPGDIDTVEDLNKWN